MIFPHKMDFKLGLIALSTVTCIQMALSIPKDDINRRIVNGKTIARGTWPFLVSLHYKKESPFSVKSTMKHTCGGTLIHPRWVLTAAHCIEFESDEASDPQNWYVVVGEYNQFIEDTGEQMIQAEEFFVHPDFTFRETSDLGYDIGLIKLKEKAVVGGPNAKVIPMDTRKRLKVHSECKIAGWGQVAAEPLGWGMYIPLEATVYISNAKKCKNKYDVLNALNALNGNEGIVDIDDSWLCAEIPRRYQQKHGGTSSTCKGDSGGPLVCKNKDGDYVVSGVATIAYGCESTKFPNGFMKVSYFQDWIWDVIRFNTPKEEPGLIEMISDLFGLS